MFLISSFFFLFRKKELRCVDKHARLSIPDYPQEKKWKRNIDSRDDTDRYLTQKEVVRILINRMSESKLKGLVKNIETRDQFVRNSEKN